ncbi:Protein of unknown function [Pseudomonas asturiensis]|uniref:DUF1654 domain-containing protein n=3 Tax=Pseudomonas TaxID=286 RepID=A0A1M7PW75_9PSED|nr:MULTISPECIES: DUF1654 domain-containing protein [Pseudomonas]MBC3954949.1 DUF1654 domain-containing protein [Pseudomonas triticifolii]QHF04627.1 DUF1654 domain-containing protein [Pseudomonas asturiensis]SHN21834.1 Protein of unknown function [Pseudomonas asturiensis]
MASDLYSTASVASSYQQIGRRIQRMVAAPNVQKVQFVTVTRLDGEPSDIWDTVLQEIEDTEGIQVDRLEDGSVCIGWKRYIDS